MPPIPKARAAAPRPTDQLVRRWIGVAGTTPFDGPAEYECGARVEVAGAFGRRQDDSGSALARHRAIQQMEGIGDERRRQHRFDRDRSSEMDCCWVDCAIHSNGRSGKGKVFGGRAELLHVPASNERVLGRRVQPPAFDELVRGARPRGGRRSIGVEPGWAAGDDDHRALSGCDRKSRLEQRGYGDHCTARPDVSESRSVCPVERLVFLQP